MKSVVCPGDASTVCGAYDHILIYSLDNPDPNTLDDPNVFFLLTDAQYHTRHQAASVARLAVSHGHTRRENQVGGRQPLHGGWVSLSNPSMQALSPDPLPFR